MAHKRAFLLLLFVFPAVLGWPGPVRAEIRLTALPPRTTVFLNLSHPQRSLVMEKRKLALNKGSNRVVFSWEGVRIDPPSIQLVLPETPDGVFIQNEYTPPGGSSRVWDLHSSQDRTLEASVRYLLAGVTKQIAYRAEVDSGEESLALHEQITLINHSGQDFNKSWIGLGHGNWVQRPLKNGEIKTVSVYRVEDIPVRKVFVVEPLSQQQEAESTSVPFSYRFSNTDPSHLGDKPLLPGKIRLFQRRQPEQSLFLGEDRIEFVPLGDSVSVRTGESQELKLRRRLLKRERLNVVRDRQGNVEMYDLEETVGIEVENFREQPVTLKIRETVSGEWEMLQHSHPFRRLSHDTIEFSVPVGSQSSSTVRFRYQRKHLGKSLR